MKRNCDLNEISDGKLYDRNDLVEASCNGCKGKANCCHGMGKSIILDPFDIYRLTVSLNTSFEKLLTDKIELNVVDGIILPNLKMSGSNEVCNFLHIDGKCSIHAYRPGICRIFPLGRYYENHGFKYFLQLNECSNQSKTMVKINHWIDTPDLEKQEQFLIDWHYFLNDVENVIKASKEEVFIKNLNMFILNNFYIKQYDVDRDFYVQFEERMDKIKQIFQ